MGVTLMSSQAFVDCLDVTFAPTDVPEPEINTLLLSAGFDPAYMKGGGKLYRTPDKRGTVRVDVTGKFGRISCSGASCRHLRDVDLWMDYLSILSSSPHSVTRLDVALDLAMDGADLVEKMRLRHPTGDVFLGRKAVKSSVILGIRADGRESGTWYAGYGSSAKATAKVYDKAKQVLDLYGEVMPPRGRIEVTAWKDYGATLRDAALPNSIFWHIASPALISKPEGVPMWQANTDGGWQAPRKDINPAEVMRRRVEESAEIDRLIELAQTFSGGTSYLEHLIHKRMQQQNLPEAVPEAS